MLNLKTKKQMKYLFQSVILSMLLFVIVSCNDDDDDVSTTGQVTFRMEGTNGSDTASTGRIMSDLEITSATAAVTEVELESESEAEDDSTSEDSVESEIEFEGQYTVDLLAGTSDPSFGIAEVEAQNYTELEVELGTFLQDNASLIIEGNYTNDSGETIPFKYSLKKALELKIESENGFEIQVGSLKEIVATIDFSLLFQNIDFDLAESNADGMVIINASLNTYVYNLISQNFSGAVEIEIEDD